jgi:Uma2 family endonuclease
MRGVNAMKAVLPEVPQFILDWRKRTGADMWDEMWEGSLHMAPSPSRAHQDFAFELESWLRRHWARPRGCRVHGAVNVAPPGGWPGDFRIPDLVLLTPDRFAIDHNEYFEGPPTAVVEIRSPGDETMEKLSFYAALGVPEVWVFDRDSKVPAIYVLGDNDYAEQPVGADGWIDSIVTDVQVRSSRERRLGIQIKSNETTRATLPEN